MPYVKAYTKQREDFEDSLQPIVDLANAYANANTNADIPGAAPGERGSKYWAGRAQESAEELTTLASLAITSGADGYFYSEFGTRYTYAVSNGRVAAHIAPHIYIDPFNGSDSNSGDTAEEALQTRAGLLEHPLMGTDGTSGSPTIITDLTIGIVGHRTQVIRDQFDFGLQNAENGYRQLHRCSFVKVGSAPVHFDCMDPASPSDFTAHSSIANAYVISWPHKINSGAQSRIRVRRRSDGRPYKRVASTGALVPGTYFMAGNPVYGTNAEIIVIAFDSGDMRSAGREVDITRRDVAISMRSGLIQGIWAEFNASNNGALVSFDGFLAGTSGAVGAPTAAIDCLLYEGTKHHAVLSAGPIIGCSAVNSIDPGDEYDHDGGGAIYFTHFETDIRDKKCQLIDTVAFSDTSLWGSSVGVGQKGACGPYYSHDTNSGGAPLRVDIDRCSFFGLSGDVAASLVGSFNMTRCYLPYGGGTSVSGITAGILSKASISHCVIGWANAGRFSRPIAGYNLDIRSNLIMVEGGYSGGAGSITTVNGPGNINFENNIFVAAAAQGPAIVDVANNTAKITASRNLFAGSGSFALLASYNNVAGPSIVSDFNIWESANPLGLYAFLSGTPYTFAQWQAEGQEANGIRITDASENFVSGLLPSPTNLDVRLVLGGDADTRLTDLITQDEIEEMRSRRRTYAECIAYYNQAPNSDPVLVV